MITRRRTLALGVAAIALFARRGLAQSSGQTPHMDAPSSAPEAVPTPTPILLPERWQRLVPESATITETPAIPQLPGLNYQGHVSLALPSRTASDAELLAPLLPEDSDMSTTEGSLRSLGRKTPFNARDIAFAFAVAGSRVDAGDYLMQGSGTGHKAALLSFAFIVTALADEENVRIRSSAMKGLKGKARREPQRALNTAIALRNSHGRFFDWLTAQYKAQETAEGRTVSSTLDVTRQALAKQRKMKSLPPLTGTYAHDMVRNIIGGILEEQLNIVAKFRESYPAFSDEVDMAIRKGCQASSLPLSVGYSVVGAESAFDAAAVNKSGATGLMQYMDVHWIQGIGALERTEAGQATLQVSSRLRDIYACVRTAGKDSRGNILYKVVDPLASSNESAKHKKKREEILALRTDPELNVLVGMSEKRTSFMVLQARLKRTPKVSEMWLANILSPATAASLILAANKDPEQTIDLLADDQGNLIVPAPAIIAQNGIFRDREGKPAKAADILQRMDNATTSIVAGAILAGGPSETVQALRQAVQIYAEPTRPPEPTHTAAPTPTPR